MINLWLDDLRPAPNGWHWAKTVEDAKVFLRATSVDNLSLDHDLGAKLSGYDLVKWMAEQKIWPKNKPVVHSMNVVGKQNIEAIINHYGPYQE